MNRLHNQNYKNKTTEGKKRRLNSSVKIFLGLVLGVLTGALLGESVQPLQAVGDIFIRLINMTVGPVVFVSLVCGVISMKDPAKMGRVASKTFLLYAGTMALATTIALFLASLFSPGKGLQLKALQDSAEPVRTGNFDFVSTLVDMIPSNIFASFGEGNILQIIVVAVLVGISVNIVGKKAAVVEEFFNSLLQVIFRLVQIVMGFAPYGVFALMAVVTGTQGFDVLSSLAGVVGIIYLSMVSVMVIAYSLGLTFLARINPLPFFKKMLEVQTVAFSTTSSAATLPVNLKVAQHKLGISQSISGFILPLGATVNMNGLSAYMGVIAVFAANLYGIELTAADMLRVVLTSTIAAIGCAGVPAAGLIVMPMVLGSIGVPLKVIGLVAAIDRIIDMMSTTTNITGDTFTAVVVAKTENELDLETYYDGSVVSSPAEGSNLSPELGPLAETAE